MTKPREWTTFMVYGSFNDPNTGLNFFIVRYPRGRVAWSKKLAPAMNRLIRGWYTSEELRRDAAQRRFRGEGDIHWNVEGEPNDGAYWSLTKSRPTRFEWNGTELVAVPYDDLD